MGYNKPEPEDDAYFDRSSNSKTNQMIYDLAMINATLLEILANSVTITDWEYKMLSKRLFKITKECK